MMPNLEIKQNSVLKKSVIILGGIKFLQCLMPIMYYSVHFVYEKKVFLFTSILLTTGYILLVCLQTMF